jgi:ribose-phosphate pyrophosphokinase
MSTNNKIKLPSENSFILSTNSHLELSKNVSEKSGIPLLNTDIDYFANKEIRTTISNSVRGKNIYIISSPNTNITTGCSINDQIMETYLLICTCRRSDAKNITLVCPLYPYSRQDKKNISRMCISAKDIADLFVNAGINRIMCFDLHSHQIQGFFNIPCDNFYCIDLIHNYLVDNHNIHKNPNSLNSEFVIVAPDEGALKRVQKYANKFKMPFMVVSKERDYTQMNRVDKAVLIGDKKYLVNRTAIIIDDMADTCGTVFKVSDLLISKGAKDIIVIVTHGIFSKNALENISNHSHIKEFIVSDSIPQTENKKKCSKLKTFTISSILSDILLKLMNGESLSEVFH